MILLLMCYLYLLTKGFNKEIYYCYETSYSLTNIKLDVNLRLSLYSSPKNLMRKGWLCSHLF